MSAHPPEGHPNHCSLCYRRAEKKYGDQLFPLLREWAAKSHSPGCLEFTKWADGLCDKHGPLTGSLPVQVAGLQPVALKISATEEEG